MYLRFSFQFMNLNQTVPSYLNSVKTLNVIFFFSIHSFTFLLHSTCKAVTSKTLVKLPLGWSYHLVFISLHTQIQKQILATPQNHCDFLNIRNIAELQDPFMDKYMQGKSNYKLKSLKIYARYNWYNVCKWKLFRIHINCPFSSWNTKHLHFKRKIVTKTSHPPPTPDGGW